MMSIYLLKTRMELHQSWSMLVATNKTTLMVTGAYYFLDIHRVPRILSTGITTRWLTPYS